MHSALLRPLFITSFPIDDFLASQDFFGSAQVLLSSASSKTAYGTAHQLALRRGQPGAPPCVGLTSATNLGFTRSLPCYDQVLLCALSDDSESVFATAPSCATMRPRCR